MFAQEKDRVKKEVHYVQSYSKEEECQVYRIFPLAHSLYCARLASILQSGSAEVGRYSLLLLVPFVVDRYYSLAHCRCLRVGGLKAIPFE